jgi:hypothetical protein
MPDVVTNIALSRSGRIALMMAILMFAEVFENLYPLCR